LGSCGPGCGHGAPSPMSRRLRVAPSPATLRPGDLPQIVDIEAEASTDPERRQGQGIAIGPLRATAAGPTAVEVVVDG
jgi:hypothetical protein